MKDACRSLACLCALFLPVSGGVSGGDPANNLRLWKEVTSGASDETALEMGADDDFWQSAKSLVEQADEALANGQLLRACRLAYAAITHDATRGDPNLSKGAPAEIRAHYALDELHRKVATEVANLCSWDELDRRLKQKTGRRAREITEEVETLLGVDDSPLNPNRARDRYKADGTKMTPMEAAEIARTMQAKAKAAKQNTPSPQADKAAGAGAGGGDDDDEGLKEKLRAIIREQRSYEQLRRSMPVVADDPYLAVEGVFWRFLGALDEVVGGLDKYTVQGVRDAVLSLPANQRARLGQQHAQVFSREERFWFGEAPAPTHDEP